MQGYVGRREVAAAVYSQMQEVNVALTGNARSMDLNSWEANPR